MIRSLEIIDPANTHIKWMAKVPALAKPQKFEFKPGLNVLCGRNGSGKSTVIKCLTQMLHCEASGNPVITHHSFQELFFRWSFHEEKEIGKLPERIKLDHDGQGVRFFDPSHAVGLYAGGAAFDDDFFEEGFANTMFKGSSGETTLYRFEKLLASVMKQEPAPKVEWRRVATLRENDSSYRKACHRVVEKFLKGTGEPGQPTVLLDEPERSLDLNLQAGIWRMIRAASPVTQIIVASHSLFAFRIPEANYIELTPGYVQGSTDALTTLMGWPAEKPEIPKVPEAEKSKTK